MDEIEQVRKSVFLAPEIVREINRLFEKGGSSHGAIQEALTRGAELAIEEKRGAYPARTGTKVPLLEVAADDTFAAWQNELSGSVAEILSIVQGLKNEELQIQLADFSKTLTAISALIERAGSGVVVPTGGAPQKGAPPVKKPPVSTIIREKKTGSK